MSKHKYIITHYQRRSPNPYGWFETTFITSKIEGNDDFYWGYDENQKIDFEEVQYNEQKGTFKKIESIISSNEDKSIWIAENGDVWLANTDNPFSFTDRKLIETKLNPEEIADKRTLDALKREPIGLDLVNIDKESLPVFIKNDLKKLLQKISQDNTIINDLDSSKLTIFDPSYISDLDSSIEGIRDSIESLDVNLQTDPDDENELLFDTVNNEYFYTVPTLFLYPFFLDKRRANIFNCGVIPYGRQTMLAVVISKKNTLYEKWQLKRFEYEDDFKKGLSKVEAKKIITTNVGIDRYLGSLENDFTINWFKDLIKQIVESNGTMQFVYGYIFLEIVKQFVLEHFYDDKYIRKLKSPEISIDSINSNPQSQFYYKYKRGISRKIPENKVLILDPSDALKISKNGKENFKKLNNGYDIIYIKHNIDIKVGIGYSMYALPNIIINDRWKEIQTIAINKLQQHKDFLLNSGIEVFDKTHKAVDLSKTKKVKI